MISGFGKMCAMRFFEKFGCRDGRWSRPSPFAKLHFIVITNTKCIWLGGRFVLFYDEQLLKR